MESFFQNVDNLMRFERVQYDNEHVVKCASSTYSRRTSIGHRLVTAINHVFPACVSLIAILKHRQRSQSALASDVIDPYISRPDIVFR